MKRIYHRIAVKGNIKYTYEANIQCASSITIATTLSVYLSLDNTARPYLLEINVSGSANTMR